MKVLHKNSRFEDNIYKIFLLNYLLNFFKFYIDISHKFLYNEEKIRTFRGHEKNV